MRRKALAVTASLDLASTAARPTCPPARPRPGPRALLPRVRRRPTPLGAALRLRGVLRPARGRLRLRPGRSPGSRSRPARSTIWRYRGAAARCPPTSRDTPNLEPGLHPAGPGRQPRAASSACARCGSRTTAATRPTRSRTASSRSRSPRPARSASRTLACASTGNLANAVAAAAARAGLRSVVLIPSDLEQAKIVTTAVYGGTLVAVEGNYDDVNRLALASSPASTRTGPSSTSTSGRTTPRAPRRSATRSPSSSAGGCPQQVVMPVASGSLLTKVDKAFRELVRARAGRGLAVPGLRRAGDRLLAGRRRRSGPATTSSARCGRTRSPSRWRSATRPTGRTCSTSARRTGGAVEDVSDDEVVEGIRLLARDRGHLRRDRGRGRPSRRCASCSPRASSTPTPRPSSSTPATGSRPSTRSPPHRRPDARPSRRPCRPSERQFAMSVTVRVPTILRSTPAGPARCRSRATLAEVSPRSTRSTPASARACSTTRASCAGS